MDFKDVVQTEESGFGDRLEERRIKNNGKDREGGGSNITILSSLVFSVIFFIRIVCEYHSCAIYSLF